LDVVRHNEYAEVLFSVLNSDEIQEKLNSDENPKTAFGLMRSYPH
jgi:hypothetical protein